VFAIPGTPAEMWRKFTFTNTPAWAFLFGAIGAAAFSSRASGYLPLTRQASKRITRIRWVFAGVAAAGVLFWIAGGVVASFGDDQTRSTIYGVFFLLGFGVVIAGILGILLARSYYGPSARIIDRARQPQPLIELRRVHPAFVAAVQQLQQARAAQFAAAQPPAPPQPPPPPPQSPFPPGKFSY
jgi:hypothetical protein